VAVGEQAVLTDGHTFQLTQPVPSAVCSYSVLPRHVVTRLQSAVLSLKWPQLISSTIL